MHTRVNPPSLALGVAVGKLFDQGNLDDAVSSDVNARRLQVEEDERAG